MKNILFSCYGLGIGGIETCLTNLLNALPEDQFNIDLLLMNPEYASLPEIKNKSVKLLNSFDYILNTTDVISYISKNGGISKNIVLFIRYCIFRLLVKMHFNPWYIFKRIDKHYDVAIAYSQNDYSPYYVIDKVTADKKVMWYHNGAYEKNKKNYNIDKNYYKKFDYFVAVSNDCKKMINQKFHFSPQQLIVLRNICDIDNILEKSESFNPIKQNGIIHIVTVGRLTKEKGADLAIDVCKILKDKNVEFCWHWVGDGNYRNEIETKIKKNKLDEIFILEGNQTNPYPFIKNCDIYVQPSYYEAYSTTITESKILCKPIITTDVGGMRDQIDNNVNGLIIPIDSIFLVNSIEMLIKNNELRKHFTENLSKAYYSISDHLDLYYKTIFK